MKRIVVAAAIVVLSACASHRDADEPQIPQTVPPAELQAASNVDARLAEMQTSMTELLERLDVLNERMNKMEAGSAGGGAASPGAAPAAAPRSPATGFSPPLPASDDGVKPAAAPAPERALVSAQTADTYRNGLMLYGRGKFDDARKTFQQVFDSDPTGDLADNSLYWIGETYFAAGNYAEAMKFYRRVTVEFAEANKAPDALFKTALAYEKTGDLGMAHSTLDDVIRRYPYSSSAASAKLELKRIKY
jgi:tol-pal system protein YbgF